jgi:hypothetical protein
MPAKRRVRRRVYSDQRDQPTLVLVHPNHVSAKAFRSSIAGMDPATSAASGTED